MSELVVDYEIAQRAFHLPAQDVEEIGMDTAESTRDDVLHELDVFLTAVPHRASYTEAERHELMNLLLDIRTLLESSESNS